MKVEGGRPGIPVLMILTVSVNVKQHGTVLIIIDFGHDFSLIILCQPTSEDMKLCIIMMIRPLAEGRCF